MSLFTKYLKKIMRKGKTATIIDDIRQPYVAMLEAGCCHIPLGSPGVGRAIQRFLDENTGKNQDPTQLFDIDEKITETVMVNSTANLFFGKISEENAAKYQGVVFGKS